MGGIDLSDTGGVRPMNISGRLVRERERLIGMTDEERAWRRQWLKDQVLAHDEPRYVPEYWKHRFNPIRRFYRWPLDTIFRALTPVLGSHYAQMSRILVGKIFIGIYTVYALHYYFKYNKNDWTTKSGWRVYTNKRAIYPGDPAFPQLSDRSKGSDYHSRNFDKSPI